MLFGRLSYKTKQFFFVLIKLSIVIGAFYFIHQKLTLNKELDFNDFLSFLSKNASFSTKNILFLLILTIFNWFFEIIKWKLLVRSIKKISFKNAMEQSLGALTASLFTPNRIGEYGAKAIYFQPSERKKVMLLNLVSNMMQMSVTLILGIAGLLLMQLKFDLNINLYKGLQLLLILVLIGVIVVIGIQKNKFRIKGFSIDRLKGFLNQLSRSILVTSFGLSFLRYLIFSFQFFALLTLFDVQLTYFNAMIVISSMYVISSIVPSIFIFDVVIKGSVAVYLFSIVGVNEFTILSIIMVMWLLNFVLPSIFGSFYVLNFNLPKTEDL